MNKIVKFLPNFLVAVLFIGVGAYSKFTGAQSAVDIFTTLNLLNMPEEYVRYVIGGAQVLAGIGIFSSKERAYAFFNVVGLAIALYYHYTTLGLESSTYLVVSLIASLVILMKSRKKNTA